MMIKILKQILMPYAYRRAAAAAGNYHFELKQGFFEQSLRDGALAHGINKVRIVFIDCDTYSSAKCAFEYVSPVMQEGAYIILDDFHTEAVSPRVLLEHLMSF